MKKVKPELAEKTASSDANGGSSMDVENGGVAVKEELVDGGMVFTSTTEFTSRLEVWWTQDD